MVHEVSIKDNMRRSCPLVSSNKGMFSVLVSASQRDNIGLTSEFRSVVHQTDSSYVLSRSNSLIHFSKLKCVSFGVRTLG